MERAIGSHRFPKLYLRSLLNPSIWLLGTLSQGLDHSCKDSSDGRR
jgi:hypothetical protein